ncbi:hypothetical protein BH09MYX1_BH09MYX1_55680 [soil metagenome]
MDHGALFDIKQAHLSSLRFGRGLTTPLGLTPARLDMLRAILEPGRDGVAQSRLRHTLSVTKTVISVMVRSLERLEFVTRVRHPADKRTYWVRLTNRAKAALRKIYFQAMNLGLFRHVFVYVFLRMPVDEENEIDGVISRLRDQLLLFREAYGLGIFNPWEANDDDGSFYYDDVPDNPNAVDLLSADEEEELQDTLVRLERAAGSPSPESASSFC